MLAYNEIIMQFNKDVLNNQIVMKISRKLNAGKSKQTAWKDATVRMKKILELAKLLYSKGTISNNELINVVENK